MGRVVEEVLGFLGQRRSFCICNLVGKLGQQILGGISIVVLLVVAEVGLVGVELVAGTTPEVEVAAVGSTLEVVDAVVGNQETGSHIELVGTVRTLGLHQVQLCSIWMVLDYRHSLLVQV